MMCGCQPGIWKCGDCIEKEWEAKFQEECAEKRSWWGTSEGIAHHKALLASAISAAAKAARELAPEPLKAFVTQILSGVPDAPAVGSLWEEPRRQSNFQGWGGSYQEWTTPSAGWEVEQEYRTAAEREGKEAVVSLLHKGAITFIDGRAFHEQLSFLQAVDRVWPSLPKSTFAERIAGMADMVVVAPYPDLMTPGSTPGSYYFPSQENVREARRRSELLALWPELTPAAQAKRLQLETAPAFRDLLISKMSPDAHGTTLLAGKCLCQECIDADFHFQSFERSQSRPRA